MSSWLTAIDPKNDPHFAVRLTRHLGGQEEGWWQGFIPEKGCVMVRLDRSFSQNLVSGQTIWIWGFHEPQPNLITALTGDGAKIVIRPPELDNARSGKSVELFSGFGGWTMGTMLMGRRSVVSVERDMKVAQAAGVQHGCKVYDIQHVWDTFMKTGKVFTDCIWVADVFGPRVMMLLSVIQIDHILASPPCQPWSSMATQAGLATSEGRYIPETFVLGHHLGAQSITMENVKGFRNHMHYEETMRFAEKARFCRAQESVDDCTGVLPLSRNRWLGCFLSQSTLVEHVALECIRRARDIRMPEDLFLGGMRGCDALFADLPIGEREALKPNDEAMSRLSDSSLIPGWWKVKPTTPETTLKARCISPKGPLIGMVASYGRQHEFDYEYLSDKGLHTMLVATPDGYRYVSPWEQVACLGFPSETVLPQDHTLAWHILGNSLSTAHALLQLYRLHTILGNISPFGAAVPALPTLCRKMQRLSLRLSNKQIVDVGGGYAKMIKSEEIMGNHRTTQLDVEVISNPHDEEIHPSKRPRVNDGSVSPTIPYVVELEPTPPKVAVALKEGGERKGQGIQFLPAAQDVEIDRMLVEADMLRVGDEAGCFRPAAIASKTSRWVQIVWGPPQVELKSLVQFAMPHASSSSIDQIESRGEAMQWTSVLHSPPHIVRFRPVHVICQVCIEFAKQSVIEEACVTTTASQWISAFAAKLNVDPISLELWGDECSLEGDSFILECKDLRSFVIRWRPVLQPCPKPCQTLRESETSWANQHDVGKNGVVHDSAKLLRFAVVHPMWKSIRTVAVDPRTTLDRVIRTLLPDMTGGDPIIQVGTTIVDAKMEVHVIAHEERMIVDLNCTKVTPKLCVEIVPQRLDPNLTDWGLGNELAPFKRFIKTPFRIHGHEYCLPGECTLLKLGASFFCQSEACQTLLVTSNCRTVDPNLTIRETCEKDVISFRAVPLPGGAKNDLSKFLSKLLLDRGVPKDGVDARVKHIMNEIPNDRLKTLSKDDESVFWQNLKKVATEFHVRLITNGELKDHQREQRTKKAGSSSQEVTNPKKPKGHQSKIDVTQVKIELDYLESEDKTPIRLLTPEEFGQDKTGAVLMTGEEASHYLPVKRMSMQPLAILVIAGPNTPVDQVQMLPALDKQEVPILLPIQIINFGDVKIKLVPGKNATSTATTVTHVIETVIRRNLVEDWNTTRDPIQYIGKHVVGFTSGALVAHFAFKTYGPNKQVVSHDKGQYYHGYLRIKDAPLEEILKSSGKSGVFMVPKGENKRPDPAFVAIPSGGETLEKMVAQCKKYTISLGVVEYGTGYAYRARRENVVHARKLLLPNAVWAEEGESRPGDSMWVVKHVPNDIAGPQLTEAFKHLGWDAVAVRPYSASTWSVSAKEKPPSPHIFINGSCTVVVPAGGAKNKTAISFAPKGLAGATAVRSGGDKTWSWDEEMELSTLPSRTEEIKVEMAEQIESVVANRMTDTQQQVHRLEEAIKAQDAKLQRIEATTSNSLQQVQMQQQQTEERLGGIEQQVGGISQTVVQQMNNMLQTMTTTLIGRLDALETDAKRQRREGQPY